MSGFNSHRHSNQVAVGRRGMMMLQPVFTHTAYDGTITFKSAETGKVVGYAGSAEFIASIVHHQKWRAFGSPSQSDGYFIAMPAPFTPEDLPMIDPGFDGWHKMVLEELLDFVDDMH